MNYLEKLPDEMWASTFFYLDKVTLCRLSITCKRFRNIASDKIFWSPLIKERFSYQINFPANYSEDREDYKKLCMREPEFFMEWKDFIKNSLKIDFTGTLELSILKCTHGSALQRFGQNNLKTLKIPDTLQVTHSKILAAYKDKILDEPKRRIYLGKL